MAAHTCSASTQSRCYHRLAYSKGDHSLFSRCKRWRFSGLVVMASNAEVAQTAGLEHPALSGARGVQLPPVPVLAGQKIGSFAHVTVSKRLPAILDSMLKDVDRILSSFTGNNSAEAQVKQAIQGVKQLQQDMLHNREVTPLQLPDQARLPLLALIAAHTNHVLQLWQQHTGERTWLGLPWLLVECYMYVRLALVLQGQPVLSDISYDPFYSQKHEAFLKSLGSMVSMAASVDELVAAAARHEPHGQQCSIKDDLFKVMQDLAAYTHQPLEGSPVYSLWGNKTDLSLLVDASKIDPAALTVSAMAPSSAGGPAHPFLIVDDYEAVWQRIQQLQQDGGHSGHRRIDIVLDNAGLELYGDLCLADFLMAHKLADEIVFHGRPLPWFVSDVMERDFRETLQLCSSTSPQQTDPAAWQPVQRLAARWQQHIAAGRWRYIQHAFWCTPSPFCWMEAVAPALHEELRTHSGLIIFKGDLNYRKLTFDGCWPWTTPFQEALMGFKPAPFLSLRTLKADVMVGLKEGQGEALGQLDPDWQVNGKFGVIQAAI